MDAYVVGQSEAFQKFAVSGSWIGDRMRSGLQDRMTRLGPGAAAQSLQEFSSRQGARAQQLVPKMRQAGLFERFARLGIDLATIPLLPKTHLSTPNGMVDDNAWRRARRQSLERDTKSVLAGRAFGVPSALAQQYASGAAIPNKPTSLLTGDRLRTALGRR